MQPHYYFIDETGQDTAGKFFIVSLICIPGDWHPLEQACALAEEISGKGKFKWGKAEHTKRLDYLRRILKTDLPAAALRYTIFHNTRKYEDALLDAVQYATRHDPEQTEIILYIDGDLSKSKRNKYRIKLRKRGLRIRAVRNVRRDENNALTRLADAIAGLVRDQHEKRPGVQAIFNHAIQSGKMQQLP